MYGWRGRIGMLLPYDNIVLEPEFARMMPEGMSAHVIRSLKTDRAEWAQELSSLASAMHYLRADVCLYCCSASSYMKGVQWHNDFIKRLEDESGIPVETANSAMVKALQHMGIHKVVIASPHPDWLIPRLKNFVEDSGFEVVNIRGLGLEPLDINPLHSEVAYKLVKELMVEEADGAFIVSTNFRCIEVIEILEKETGKPILGVNPTLLWAAMKRIGINEFIPGWGSLLSGVSVK